MEVRAEAAKWVLPPQFSHHPQGLAIDVNYPDGSQPAHSGLNEMVRALGYVGSMPTNGGILKG